MKLKALWYCTKNKPYLIHMPKDNEEFEKGIEFSLSSGEEFKQACIDIKNNGLTLNGKIACVSDYDVEKVKEIYCCGCLIQTKTMCHQELLGRSRLTDEEFNEYRPNYAIHIKNLEIFDKPKELSDFYTYDDSFDNMFGWLVEEKEKYTPLKRAPQNMCYAVDEKGNRYVIISVHPEWLCLILNGLKDVELRRKVLKEMIPCE